MRKCYIAPSILSADFGYLMDEVKAVEGEAEYLHVDVMDGHYVDNLSFGIPIVESLRKHTDMILDVHLMITNPAKYIKRFAEAGADIITFHLECTDDPEGLSQQIRDMGLKSGIAVHPDTPIEKILPFVDKTDKILLMTVRPGFGGQGYMEISDDRIKAVRKAIDDKCCNTLISCDGGINHDTAARVYGSGCDILVAGDAVFRNDDHAAAIRDLLASAVK
ncbi:MAG: ribulose-phosphate 3-epimerase [Clostridiales bacterium]|nr:ribulose-phosphate 3-epimerase [Clostridiales bacterium]